MLQSGDLPLIYTALSYTALLFHFYWRACVPGAVRRARWKNCQPQCFFKGGIESSAHLEGGSNGNNEKLRRGKCFPLCSGGAEDAFREAKLHARKRHATWGNGRTNWCAISLPKMSSSGHCISTRVHKKMGKLRADFRPVEAIKVQLPPRNWEGAFVQEVFWDHSERQKGLVPKLSNHEIFLMNVRSWWMKYFSMYATGTAGWGQPLIGTVIMKVSPRRKSCQENSAGNGRQKRWRKAKGPHKTAKPQTAMRCDKGGKVRLQHTYAPAVPGCWSGPVGRQVHYNELERSWSCILILGWINAMGATAYPAARRQAGGGSDPPSPWASVGMHSPSSILTREADRVI